MSRLPVTLISGPLGSGKTTLLRHILERPQERLAIIMNEFGEIAIDSRIIEGTNVQMAELGGGCVCCSLLGEFEAAVDEIIQTVDPERLIVETTGLAEPEALAFDIEENLPQVRLDGVIIVLDADALVRFPTLGHTTRLQIEAADFILLNKIDLVDPPGLEQAETRIRELSEAPIVRTSQGKIDPPLLFGIQSTRDLHPPEHTHQTEFDSFSFRTQARLRRGCFESVAEELPAEVYRAKGFVRFEDQNFLFNFVAGRWQLEPFDSEETVLVFIGRRMQEHRGRIEARLTACIDGGR